MVFDPSNKWQPAGRPSFLPPFPLQRGETWKGGSRSSRRLAAILAIAFAPGCGLVSKSRVDDCTKVAQSLRAENGQLKDTALSLRGENNDLTDRSVNDSRKITALEEANGRLESSVQAYIDEREDLNVAFQRFKRQAQATVATPSAAMNVRLRSFASARPGTTFDPEAGVIAVEADRLFLPGTDKLRPGALDWLNDCASILADPEAKAWSPVIAGHAAESTVRRASTSNAAPPSDLSLARAIVVRNALADRAQRDPNRMGVAGLGTSRPLVDGDNARNARIEIELSPTNPGTSDRVGDSETTPRH